MLILFRQLVCFCSDHAVTFILTSRFKGHCEDLKGHVYNYMNPHQAADQYTKMTQEICKYIGRSYKYGTDARTALESLNVPVFVQPEDPPANASWMAIRMWEKRIDELVKKETVLKENLKTVFSLIYEQCSDDLRAKLESREDHAQLKPRWTHWDSSGTFKL